MRAFLNLLLLMALFVLSEQPLFGQELEKKRLMRNINVPLKSHIFPSLTGDGLYMIFYSDYSNTGNFELKYSRKTGLEFWEEAQYVENVVKHHNDHFGSYCISYDGRYLFFSSYRANGIGKYDIWFSERNGDSWSTPQNPGKPLNSPENDGNPCLSPDGKSLYFMRCKEMDAKGKAACKIYVSRKISDKRWGEAEALPDHINAYHSTTPRILIDNETLVYSSERPGGKGGLDLYMTRLTHGQWSDPLPYGFINTIRNDEFISVPARGDLVFYTDVYKDQNNIYKAIIPEELRPRKVLLITGKVFYTDRPDLPTNISVQAYQTSDHTLVSSVKPNPDGTFFIALPEGNSYDFSVFPLSADHTYYSELFDLNNMPNPKWEKLEIPLEPLQSGTSIELPTVEFETYNRLDQRSAMELKRLLALLQKNPGLSIEIGVFLDSVVTDSLPNPGLTKVLADTSFLTLNKADLFENGESLTPSQEDSLAYRGYLFLRETDLETTYYKTRYTYTNDDSQEKAEAIAADLISKGAPPHRIVPKGYGDDAVPDWDGEDRGYKVVVKFF